MLYLLSATDHGSFPAWLRDMHRLRYRVFKQRLGWSVETSGELEADRFDDIGPSYIVYRDAKSAIRGCARLLPSTGPNMLRDVFPELSDPGKIPNDPMIWESSQFAMDLTEADKPDEIARISPAILLFLGMIEFGLSQGLTSIVTVTDVRIERILKRAGWPMRRLGEPRMIGDTEAVAGLLEISDEALDRVRNRAGVAFPVLWMPALRKRS